MISKKRGMLLLVLVIALLILSVDVIAPTLPVNTEMYVAIGGKYDEGPGCCSDWSCGEECCDNADVNIKNLARKGTEPGWEGSNWWSGCNAFSDCMVPPTKGCWFLIEETDSAAANDDDNAWLWSHFGEYFYYGDYHDAKEGNQYHSDYDDKYTKNDDGYECVLNYNFKYHNALICASDGYWHECADEGGEEGEEGTLGTIAWVKGTIDGETPFEYIYNCTLDDPGFPIWEIIATDLDYDGYTSDVDCDEDIFDDDSLTECPELDGDSGEIACEYPKHSKCAICINPGAPETCGDTVDNDCNGKIETCDEFKEGCSQSEIPVDNLDVEGGAWPGPHENIHGIKFPWVQTENNGDGFCCGFNGLEDLGKTVIGISSESGGGDLGEFVCLNKELTGKDTKAVVPGEEEKYCMGDWCLSNAIGMSPAGGEYTIFTVKQLGETPYDIVSNGENWWTCNETSLGWLQEYPKSGLDKVEVDYAKLKSYVNRFYCYDEGDHYAWAECADVFTDRKNKGVKGRYPGDGLYSLPLTTGETDGGIRTSFSHEIFIALLNNYESFYGKDHYLDFTDYKYINFMVQFCDGDCTDAEILTLKELKEGDYLPLNIDLSLIGTGSDGKDTILFSKPVLGDMTNSPQFDPTVWLHIKTKIPSDIRRVKTISFKAAPPAEMRVKNVYLSVDEDNVPLCSGQYAGDESSWLTDMDQGVSKEDITGEKLCTALYGTNAWLGKDNQINTAYQEANCCGDDENEYYAGPSMGEEEERYGCWNSQTIKDKGTSMNVEFKVDYTENIIDFTYKPVPITGNLNINFNIKYKACTDEVLDYVDGDAVIETTCEIYETVKSRSKDLSTLNAEFDLKDYINEQFGEIRTDLIYTQRHYNDISVHVEDIDLEIINPNHPANKVYLFDAVDSGDLGTEAQVNLITEVSLIIEQGETVITKPSTNQTSSTYDYSCSEPECLYPLPGDPSKERKIENPHPELYDLYFVYYDETSGITEEELIDGKASFSKPGNVIAKAVPQQVIFIADDLDSSFYSCQAAEYISKNVDAQPFLEPQDYCSFQGDQFCSPSYRVPATGEQDQYTLVNSWSPEQITEVGYKDEGDDATFDDFETYFDNLVLQLKPPNTIIEPKDRNYTTSVVPFRNIIPNAEFRSSGPEFPHWEILKNDKLVKNENDYTDKETKGMIKLKGSETLRSEKIAINKSGTYYISNNGSAKDIKIISDDPTNKITIDSDGTFEPDSQFIIIEFSKGTVYQPFLQLVDDFGPGEYNYEHQNYPDNFDFRSGLSCCKQDQCWNGYTCVEPMENVALMTEHFGVGKDYRCIDGQWTHLPLKWDWNNLKRGFCTQEEQCFVTKNGEAENTISSFLDEGDAPICINPGESILDHYCQDGQWTSRTKFLASKLVEVAGNDEFILYCTHYTDSLLDYGDEIYLGGESQEESENTPSLGEDPVSLAQEDELSYTCFPNLWDVEGGRELVLGDENTCINNMCVLRYTEGGKFKTAFATTLNKDLNDTASSFLLGFNVDPEELNTICEGGPGFVKCAFDGPDMWYSKELNAIVYGKQGIQLSGNIFGNALNGFLDWVKDISGIGTEIPEFEQFVFQASNFNEIYLLNKEGKKAKVVRELVNGSDVQQQSILAEYEGFSTPICDYVDNLALPEDLQTEFLLTVEGYNKYNCTSEAGKQKLQIIVNQDDIKGLDYFWPQLTGKLRVGSFD
jgi:hypothetical protein